MQNSGAEQMSREEIIKYVDELIEENKDSYDKRLAPLLYEFFLRANEKFEWSREEFLNKYENFRKIKGIGSKKLNVYTAVINYKEKAIYFNKRILSMIKRNTTSDTINRAIIDTLFHEGLHGTDFYVRDNKLLSMGLYEVKYDQTKDEYSNNEKDTMFDEYANVLSSSLISSDKPMYENELGINVINNGSYSELNLPGSIICAAFDITEIEMAKLKDKGRTVFDSYLEDKFPYLDIQRVMDVFTSNLNVIFNSGNKGKASTAIGLGNIVDTALNIINVRIDKIPQEELHEESIQRTYYDIYKIEQLLQKLDGEYNLKGKKEVYTSERDDTIKEFFNRLDEYRKLYKFEEFGIEKIAKRYYVKSNEPLNDNTTLIDQVRMNFRRPTIKEMFKRFIGKVNTKVLPEAENERNLRPVIETKEAVEKQGGEVIVAAKVSDREDLKSRIKYETPIIVHNKNMDKQIAEKAIQKDKGEPRE